MMVLQIAPAICEPELVKYTIHTDKLKNPKKGSFDLYGGELAGFQDQCIQPLCHLSGVCGLSTRAAF